MKSGIKKILLIMSFLRKSKKAVAEAINLAKELDAELTVLFVLDVEYADRIAHKLTDEGWLGNKPSDKLYAALLGEYKTQAEEMVAEIEGRAQELDIPIRTIIKSGSLLKEALRIASLEEPDLIVVTRRKRSSLSRLIFGSAVKALKEQVSCKVQIIDEE